MFAGQQSRVRVLHVEVARLASEGKAAGPGAEQRLEPSARWAPAVAARAEPRCRAPHGRSELRGPAGDAKGRRTRRAYVRARFCRRRFRSIHPAGTALPNPAARCPRRFPAAGRHATRAALLRARRPPSRSLLSRGPRGARLARAGNRPAPSHPLPPGAPRPGAAGRPPPSRRLSRPQVRRDGPRERGRPGRGPGAAGAERGAAERRGGGGGAGRGAAAPRGEAGGREEESRANFVWRARSRPGLRVRVSAERSGPGRGLRGKG